MPTLQEYITQINAGEHLEEIDLGGHWLTDKDVEQLMSALKISKTASTLKKLNLYNNKITSINIPEELVALQVFQLHHNKLTSISIPKEFVALQSLFLNNNQLTSINIPKELVALQSLFLQYNQLTSINIPKELVALQGLYLNVNQLTSINIPKELVVLQVLYLNGNQLTSINIPKELVALQELKLHRNQLTSINIPKKIVILRGIELDNNPLTPVFIAILKIFRYLKGNFYIYAIDSKASLTTESLTQHFSIKPAGRLNEDTQKNILLQLLKQAVIAAQIAKQKGINIILSALIIGTDIADLIPTENPAATLEYMRSMFSWEQDKLNSLPREAQTFISTGLKTINDFKQQQAKLLKSQQERFEKYSFTSFFVKLCENIATIIESEDITVKKEKLNNVKGLFGSLDFNIKVLQAQDYLDVLKPALMAKKLEVSTTSPKGPAP